MISKIKKIIFLILIATLVVTFFTRNRYKNINDINPEVLEEPIQREAKSKDTVRFTKDDYEYELTPLYDYEINGLIVHKMDYTFFSLYKYDSVFPIDLCILWGDNVKNKVYQSKTLKFSQDMRWCFCQWREKIDFNLDEFSNNHLIVNNHDIEKKIKSLSVGDQIKIKGQLVDVKANNIGSPGQYDPEYFEMKTSTERGDSGAGACEIIYVNDIEILKKSNPISYYLFKISFYGLILFIVVNILWFFFQKRTIKRIRFLSL